VLQCVEAGERITVIGQRELFRRKVGPGEADVGEPQMEVADVEDFDLPKGGDMGHKTVNAGADVHVPDGVVLKDLPGDVKILVKVVFRENPAFLVLLLKAGVEFSERKTFPGDVGLTPDLSIFLEKDRHPLQIGEKGHPLDDDPETHDNPPFTSRGCG
jgi:hypothetical protein